MPASACDAAVNILSATHNTVDIGLTVAFEASHMTGRIPIRGPGKKGPSCRPMISKDFVAMVRFLVGPPMTIDASGSLVLNALDGDGDTQAMTITTMLADMYRRAVDRESPPGTFEQDFLHKGDMDTNPQS